MEYLQPLAKHLEELQARIAVLEAQLAAAGGVPSAAAPSASSVKEIKQQRDEPLPESIVAYDELVNNHLKPFVAAAKKLGADPEKLAAIVEKAFTAQRNFLLTAARCKKPSSPQAILAELSDIQACIKEVSDLRDNRSDWTNHQNTVSEGIQSLTWLTVEPSPVSFVESFIGGADFWGNKIRVQFKTTNQDQIAFVNNFKSLLLALMAYVKEHHKTGVTWNPKGADITTYKSQGPSAAAAPIRPPSPKKALSPKAVPRSASASSAPVDPSVQAFSDLMSSALAAFVESGKQVGGDPEKLALLVQQGFEAEKALLIMATKCAKPSSQKAMQTCLADIQKSVKQIVDMKDNRSEWSNHQNAVAEGIQSLGWVAVEPAPIPFIESYIDGSEFWSNKIRVQCKTSNPEQVTFVNNFKALLTELKSFVKAHHKTGLAWNSKGGDVASYQPEKASAPSQAPQTQPQPAAQGGGAAMKSLFSSIQSIDQSQGKTAGLKHVSKDQQTWRKEYQAAKEPAKPAPSPPKAAVAGSEEIPKGEPVKELRQDKWIIENQGKGQPIEIDVELRQQVMIYNCINAVIIVKGKCKSIAIDKCKKTGVVLDNAVSAVEVVNSKKIQIQVNGKVPSVAIDKSDGVLLHLSAECAKEILIASSKSSEMNVQFPGEDGEFIERPIPEQFVHKIEGTSVTSQVSDLYSH